VAALARPVIPSATLSTFTPASPVTLAMPVAEPSAQAVAAPANADTSGTDLPFVYRSDSRDLKTLQKTSGFQPWEPFTLQQSRDLLKLYARAIELAQCSFREKVGKHALALEESAVSPNRTPLDLSQWVIRSKARGPSVSTDPREDCGGYNNGFIYKIDCRHLHPVDWKSAIPGMRARQTAWWPKLYLDSDSLDTATAIAMKSKGDTEEVTFFTPIAFDLISLR